MKKFLIVEERTFFNVHIDTFLLKNFPQFGKDDKNQMGFFYETLCIAGAGSICRFICC